MKKMNYEAPQMDIVHFEMEEVLANLIPSGSGESPEVGGITINGGNNTNPVNLF